MKKLITQKLNQLLDRMIDPKHKLEVSEDIRNIKLSNDDDFLLNMLDKWKSRYGDL